MRIAIIFHRLGPYHLARLGAAGKRLSIVAIETSGADDTYAWDVITGSHGFERVTLFELGDAQKEPARVVSIRISAALDKSKPQAVVIPGWSDSAAIGALVWCMRNQVPAIVMSESTAWDESRVAWKEWLKRRIVGLASTALVGGHPHAGYMQQLGMPIDRVCLGYDAVDNDYFAAEAARWQKLKAESLKTNNETEGARPQHPYFLASNRFIEKKNLFRLLEAYALYCTSGQWTGDSDQRDNSKPFSGVHPWDLCMLGDGELRDKLVAQCVRLGLKVVETAPWEFHPPAANRQLPIVFFPGFRQIDELPRFYAHAGAFVHASTTEQWGLVVNEAMASSLPVIVSNRVGCARDLVEEGVNGFTFEPYNVEELATLLGRTAASDFPLSEFGAASARRISDWGPDRFASGLKGACEKAVEIGPRKVGIFDRLLLHLLIHLR